MPKPQPFLTPPLDPNIFATKKYQWKDLRDIIDNKKFPIYRHVDHETTYRLYSQKLKQEWKSIYDFVLVTKFKFGKRLIRVRGDDSDCENNDEKKNEDSNNTSIQSVEDYDYESVVAKLPGLPRIPSPPKGHVWESYRTKVNMNENGNFGEKMEPNRLLAKNDFPYYIEDGIEHWCLWKLGGGDVNDKDIQWAKDELNMAGEVSEMMHWINPVHLKSLPNIDHAHIVCLMKR